MVEQSVEAALENIWADDLFDRRAEAELLTGYLESVYGKSSIRHDFRSYTIAIDASYGEGKSFFLKRFSEHVALKHPVAFVDAWADDLADEPLIAIAATLKAALQPLLGETAVQSRWDDFMEKSGKVARIAGVGLLKKGLGLLITASAVEGLSDVLSEAGDDVKKAVDKTIEEASKDVSNAAIEVASGFHLNQSMKERVEDFEVGRSAIAEMKASLVKVVDALAEQNLDPPIVIIIDELDRCRPTYALKMLEEIKHLFDVPGVCFVFGLHGDQLSHSVRSAYGPDFDGKSYLRRFFRRRYTLATPDFSPLISKLLSDTVIEGTRFIIPNVMIDGGEAALAAPNFISQYMNAFNLRARDAFEIIDMLETCVSLAAPAQLELSYLIPLLVGHVKGLPPGKWPSPERPFNFQFRMFEGGNWSFKNPQDLTANINDYASRSDRELSKLYNSDSDGYAINAVMNSRQGSGRAKNSLTRIDNYPKLITTVGRFRNPSILL